MTPPASSTARTVTWYSWDQIPRESVSPMLDRKLITGDRMMLAHVYLKKGCIVPKHSHENEQLTYILDGALTVIQKTRWRNMLGLPLAFQPHFRDQEVARIAQDLFT